MSKRDLSKYDHSIYQPGRNGLMRGLWYLTNMLFFKSSCFPVFGLKRTILRWFGAKIGKGVVIKPCVNIKYPWRLSVGDYSWIGENVWIENAGDIVIGNHCCISQGAMLLSGNHDFKSDVFAPTTSPIILKDGAWVGAKAVVCMGVTMDCESILTVNSVLTRNTSPRSIWQGNPAVEKKKY